MSTITVFIMTDGRDGLVERKLDSGTTIKDLHKVLSEVGVEITRETHEFLGSAEEPLPKDPKTVIRDLKDGVRIHVTRCRRIQVTVNYLERSEDHRFSPGARLREVKEWAARKLKIDAKDAAEHVLQICGSAKRPSSDTTLHELTDNKVCAVCFDLVPEKRVEG